MNMEAKLNAVFKTAWDYNLDIKGIIVGKKHKKEIDKVSGFMGEATVFENNLSQMVVIVYS